MALLYKSLSSGDSAHNVSLTLFTFITSFLRVRWQSNACMLEDTGMLGGTTTLHFLSWSQTWDLQTLFKISERPTSSLLSRAVKPSETVFLDTTKIGSQPRIFRRWLFIFRDWFWGLRCFHICREISEPIQFTGWMVRDRIPVGTRFSGRPDQPWGPPSHLYNGYWFFLGG